MSLFSSMTSNNWFLVFEMNNAINLPMLAEATAYKIYLILFDVFHWDKNREKFETEFKGIFRPAGLRQAA